MLQAGSPVHRVCTDPAQRAVARVRAWSRLAVADVCFRTRAPLLPTDLARLEAVVTDESEWEALEPLSNSRNSSVARLQLCGGWVVVKRYLEPGVLGVRSFGRPCRAEREAMALGRVAELLPDNAVRAIAWGETRRYGLVSRNYLISNEMEESYDLRRIRSLGSGERAAAIRAVLDELPRRIALLHAGGLFARSLRGKNTLYQPVTGRIALIDLPNARLAGRLGWRERRHDLATMSLELRRFLDAGQWSRFVADYRRYAELTAGDTRRISVPSVERRAARLAHRTPWSSARRSLRRRLRRSLLASWATGRRFGGGSGDRR